MPANDPGRYRRRERKRGSRDPDPKMDTPPSPEPTTPPGPPLFPVDEPFSHEDAQALQNQFAPVIEEIAAPASSQFSATEFQPGADYSDGSAPLRGQVETEFTGVGGIENAQTEQGDNTLGEILREIQIQSNTLDVILATLSDMQGNGITLRA